VTVLFVYSAVVVAVGAIALDGLPSDLYFESVVGILAFVALGRWLEARMRQRAAEPIATIVDGALTPPEDFDEEEPVVRDTAPVRIARIVSEAHKHKASIQRRIEEVAGVYVPAVMALAVAAFLGWMWLGPQPPIALAVLALVGILVWAAPGMLSLATPTAVTTAVGRGVELGVLFRGGDVVEKIRRIDTLVFHKTNALTEGTSTVTHVVGAQRADDTTVSPGEILQVAAAVEAHSSHPIATAIVQEAQEKGVEIAGVARFVEMQGRGVRGIVGKFLVEVISVRHARERSLKLGRLAKEVDRHVLQGRKPVVVVVNDTVRGLIIVSDPVKANAKEAIERLRGLGFTLFMLSGDSKAMARLVAKEIGIERVVAEVEPANKADEIKRLQDDGRVVGVVGDGVTHALALAQADVGFAIGTGPDIATKASDATLTRGDLTGLVTTIQLARKTMRVVRANVVLTAVYNIVGIPLAAGLLYPVAGVVLHPVLAAAAMSVASAGILANCARIRRFTPTNTT
jgi:Cu+-exporting ATPase